MTEQTPEPAEQVSESGSAEVTPDDPDAAAADDTGNADELAGEDVDDDDLDDDEAEEEGTAGA